MRSSILLAAFAATCVSAAENQVIVTDWSEVVVTETVTAPAVTETLPPVQQQQVVYETETEAPAAPTTTQQTELAKKSTIVPKDAETQVWSTAWTWEITPTAEPQPATTTLATSTSSAQAAPTGANEYQQAALYNHNIHRSNHSAPSVDWDNALEQSAQVLASRCVYEHDV